MDHSGFLGPSAVNSVREWRRANLKSRAIGESVVTMSLMVSTHGQEFLIQSIDPSLKESITLLFQKGRGVLSRDMETSGSHSLAGCTDKARQAPPGCRDSQSSTEGRQLSEAWRIGLAQACRFRRLVAEQAECTEDCRPLSTVTALCIVTKLAHGVLEAIAS